MSDRVVFQGVHPAYDGEYEFDASSFTHGELHTIKRLSGCRAGEVDEALEKSDTDIVVAVGVIVLQRHGKQVDEDVLWNSKAGSIQLAGEPDPVPLDEPSPTVNDSQPSPSGPSTENTSENPGNGQSRTGTPPSDMSAMSEFATSPI